MKNLKHPWNLYIPQRVHNSETFSLDFLNAPHTKKKNNNLRTDHWKVIWGTKNCYSVALLSVSSVFSYQVKKKKQLKTFILKSVQNTP